MLTRPWSLFSSRRSWSSLTDIAVGFVPLGGCWAEAVPRVTTTSIKPSAASTVRNTWIPNIGISLPSFVVMPSRRGTAATPPLVSSKRDRFAIGGLPAPGARAVAALHHPLLVDLGDDVAVAGEQRLRRAHLGAERQLALGEAVAAVFDVLGFGVVGLRPAGAIGALVHLAARAEIADPRVLRRAERAGVEAIAAADAQILRVQHDGVGRGVEAVHRAHRRAGRVGAVHAGHRDRALARLAVVQRHDAAAIDAPGHVVLVLAGGDAGVALDAAVGVAEEFHAGHVLVSPLRRADLTQGGLRLLHARDRVEAAGRDGVDAFAEHDRVGALRIPAAHVLALVEAREVERHPGDAFADPVGDERLDLGLGLVLGAGHPDPLPVLDAALGGVAGVDLDEHVLLQLGEPFVRARLLAAALVFDETAGGEDDREVAGDVLLDRGPLHREADVRHPELPRIRQGRILRHEFRPRRVDRLAVDRDRVRQVPGIRPGLAVAVVDHPVLEADPLDAAREVDRPRHRVDVVAADALDDGELLRLEVLVPAELLQHAHGELGVAVGQLRALGVGALGEERLAVALESEAR